MRFLFWCLFFAWCSVVLEITFSERIPRGALFLPVVGAVLLWMPSARGVLAGGVLLLLDWIIRPTLLPCVPFLIPFIAIVLSSGRGKSGMYQQRRVSLRLPDALQLPCLVLLAMLFDQLSQIPISTWPAGDVVLWEPG